jgi:protein-disulfide isomerase
MTSEPKQSSVNSLLVGVACLAVGFIVGREVSSGGGKKPDSEEAAAPTAAAPAPSPSVAPSPEPPPGAGGRKKVTIPPHAPRKGSATAKVTIVAFSDFQCPFCSRVVPTLKQIEEKYKKDVAVVFMNQPLPFHNNAGIAAQAFLAAARQDKAWEMHDKLFENQRALDRPSLDKYAQDLGLKMPKFKKDFDDPEIQKQIKSDSDFGSSVGANGTPTFFVNGRELVGAQPLPAFEALIDQEIKTADGLLAKGVKPGELYAKLLEEAGPGPGPGPGPGGEPSGKVEIEVGGAPSKGPKNAKVTIVTFSDFQCPFCSRVNPTMEEIEKTYKGKVRIAFKHLPLPFHDNAQVAAEAALAAHAQGKFWEMHDKLFANQGALDRASLETYAKDLGLNVAQFKAALDSGKYADYVKQDAALASRVGANGTPAFFINGKLLSGAQPFPAFKQMIDEALTQ